MERGWGACGDLYAMHRRGLEWIVRALGGKASIGCRGAPRALQGRRGSNERNHLGGEQ